MFFPFLTVSVLSCLTGCAMHAAAGPTDEQATPTRTIVVCGDGAGPKTFAMCVKAPEEHEGRCVVVSAKSEDEKQPKVWIGVRLTPVPAPLAAHIGDRGVMILNVVRNSPADKAGLEQYDVVIGSGDQEIKGAQELTEAVGKAEPGKAIKLTIIRKGAKQELQITPAERSAEVSMDMKYTEPEESFVDDAVKLYGRALMLGPNGTWITRDLGAMKKLPRALEELKKFDIDVNVPDDALRGLDDLDRKLDLQILRELDESKREAAGEDKDVRVEVKIQVDKDGQSTTITRDADGKIHVTHKDAEGKESSAVYDDAGALEKADPEAFGLYERHSADGAPDLIHTRPHGDLFREYRRDFQVDVEKKLKEALAQAKGAYAQAEAQAERAAKEAEKGLREAHVAARAHWGQASAAAKEILMVRVDDQGAIRVTVTKDGEKTVYKFKNKEEFKESEPDLYEQVESLLE
jgi:hypothetical protein